MLYDMHVVERLGNQSVSRTRNKSGIVDADDNESPVHVRKCARGFNGLRTEALLQLQLLHLMPSDYCLMTDTYLPTALHGLCPSADTFEVWIS